MNEWDYGRLGSLLRLAADRLLSMAEDHEQKPTELKSVAFLLGELGQAEREVKACRKIVLRERQAIRQSGKGT